MEQLACLMEEEKHHLHRYACYKIGDADEADDILQEMFLRLCSKSHLLTKVDNMRNYLYRTLANQCGMLLRTYNRLCRHGSHSVHHLFDEKAIMERQRCRIRPIPLGER